MRNSLFSNMTQFVLAFFLCVIVFGIGRPFTQAVDKGDQILLEKSYLRESSSAQYYGEISKSAKGDEKLLFEKIREERRMHIKAIEKFFEDHQWQLPAVAIEDSQLNRPIDHGTLIRESIAREMKEVGDLTDHIGQASDAETKNFLSYLRIESFLHSCEIFLLADLQQLSVSVPPEYAESCREITALRPSQKSPPESSRTSEVLISSSVVNPSLLAQSNYYPNYYNNNYGSLYEGYGYQYLAPYPFYNTYPSYNYPYYPTHYQQQYNPRFPQYPYSGHHGGNYYDFNFYYHNPYNSGYCYTCYSFPYGGGYGGTGGRDYGIYGGRYGY